MAFSTSSKGQMFRAATQEQGVINLLNDELGKDRHSSGVR